MSSTVRFPASATAGSRPVFGAWVKGALVDGGSTPFAAIEALESSLGARLGIVHWYRGWADRAMPDLTMIRSVIAKGYAPLITWEPWDYTKGIAQSTYALRNITAGSFDGYIDGWADGLASIGTTVYLRFAHEMNSSTYPWCIGVNGNTAAEYVAAFRHVVSRFRARGASNVRFIWCPAIDWAGSGRVPFASIFPGDEVVDLLGLDGYNGGTALPWGGWQSFAQIFEYSFSALAPLSTRDIWVCETASAEAGGSKAQWITDMWSHLATRPRVTALLWYNEIRETDWRIESSPSSLEAMKAALVGSVGLTSTPSPTSTPSATASATSTPSPSATPTSTATPAPSPTASATPEPTSTATATPTPTSTPAPTPTASSTPSPTATSTPTATPTPTVRQGLWRKWMSR